MDCWAGVILRVDLARSTITQEKIGWDEMASCIGGRALAVHLLTKEVDAGIDPLGPGNKMILAPGVLTGTAAPGTGRVIIASKSPVTGGVACSNIGGFWAAELKMAGYDALVVEGKSAEPVYLWIGDSRVEIRPAGHMWGNGTGQVASQVRKETEVDAAVISIGPAGERLARLASVVEANKRWSSGRGGLGAVMGAKNLKAIGVKGTRAMRVANMLSFQNANQELNSAIRAQNLLSFHLANRGTMGLAKLLDDRGVLPSYNFQGPALPNDQFLGNVLSPEFAPETYLRRRISCFACPVACGRATEIPGSRGEGPELEDLLALGFNCGISDLKEVIKASYICEDLGIDPVAAGGVIACAMELQTRGLLEAGKTGPSLEFGNIDGLLDCLGLIASRRGLGEVMAEGGLEFARQHGHPELFMGVKGQALSVYDPRDDEVLALSCATSNTGVATIVDGSVGRSLFNTPGSASDAIKTVEKVVAQQNAGVAMESAGICPLIAPALDAGVVANLVQAATGVGSEVANFLRAGERAWELERDFNVRAGISPSHDRLPDRLQQSVDPKRTVAFVLADLVQEYYRARGWNSGGEG